MKRLACMALILPFIGVAQVKFEHDTLSSGHKVYQGYLYNGAGSTSDGDFTYIPRYPIGISAKKPSTVNNTYNKDQIPVRRVYTGYMIDEVVVPDENKPKEKSSSTQTLSVANQLAKLDKLYKDNMLT